MHHRLKGGAGGRYGLEQLDNGLYMEATHPVTSVVWVSPTNTTTVEQMYHNLLDGVTLC